MKRSSTRFGTIAWTMVFTLAATLVVLNFSSGEKKLDEEIKREYSVRDAQHQRALWWPR